MNKILEMLLTFAVALTFGIGVTILVVYLLKKKKLDTDNKDTKAILKLEGAPDDIIKCVEDAIDDDSDAVMVFNSAMCADPKLADKKECNNYKSTLAKIVKANACQPA